MKIITTPMCEEIVKLAGISEYIVDKNPDNQDGDVAVVLSESNVVMKSISVKINTALQIFKSIKLVSKILSDELNDDNIRSFFKDYDLCSKYLNNEFKRDVTVKVYSEFLCDIVSDVGFAIDDNNFDFVIYPDYLKNSVVEDDNLVEIPSHNFISKNPFKKAELRYAILENLI